MSRTVIPHRTYPVADDEWMDVAEELEDMAEGIRDAMDADDRHAFIADYLTRTGWQGKNPHVMAIVREAFAIRNKRPN